MGTSPVLEILRHVVFPGPIFLSPGCPSVSALHWLLPPLLSLPRLPCLPASLPCTTPPTRDLPPTMSSQRVSSILETSCKSMESLWPTPQLHLREQSLELSISSRMVFWTW